jgi:hypothetical protein
MTKNNGTKDITVVIVKLTPAEKQELVKCENVIRTNRKAFEEIVRALAIIHEKKLYRASHSSFQEYCSEKWQFTRDYGYKLVQAYYTEQKLLASGVPQEEIPTTENGRRTVAKLANDTAKAEGRVVEPEDFKNALEEVKEAKEGEVKKTTKKKKSKKGTATPSKPEGYDSAKEHDLPHFHKWLIEGIAEFRKYRLPVSAITGELDATSSEMKSAKLVKK